MIIKKIHFTWMLLRYSKSSVCLQQKNLENAETCKNHPHFFLVLFLSIYLYTYR